MEERFSAGRISRPGSTPCNTAVVGTGAAGYNAADRLWQLGPAGHPHRDGEPSGAGTSRNTGSDKQTYYKLTLSGGDADSVREMARDALLRASAWTATTPCARRRSSAQGFLKLCGAGRSFPAQPLRRIHRL